MESNKAYQSKVNELWDNPLILQFDPNDPEELAFTLHKAVKKSGLTLAQITGPKRGRIHFPTKSNDKSHIAGDFRRAGYRLLRTGVNICLGPPD